MVSDQSSIDDIINQAKSDEPESQDAPAPEAAAETTRLAPNKIIDRLDDVTIKSEEEASKIVDLIDDIMNKLANAENSAKELKQLITDKKDETKQLEMVSNIGSSLAEVQDMLFNTMNLLQYQDVLRQKIEKIAGALSVFYSYLGEFLGKGIHKEEDRAVGRTVEDSTLNRDQKLEEIDDIIKDIKKDS